MAEKIKVFAPDAMGKIIEVVGVNMDISETKEPWSEYILEDGTKIKAKQAVINIVKLEQNNPDGTPVYVLQSQSMMSVLPKI